MQGDSRACSDRTVACLSVMSVQIMQAVVEIQKRLPNARVLYVSATGATEAENLCYMTRLGLWGDKTAFRNKLDFVSMLQQRGVGELLTWGSVV